MTDETDQPARPFLKWVGGKGKLVPDLQKFMPKKYNDYYEPFLGGGAFYFKIHKGGQKAHLNDLNEHLIAAYKHIKIEPETVIAGLKRHEKDYHKLNELDQKDYYLQQRIKFNNIKYSSVEKTVLLIFLNKTGFNGMYRENSKGEFNIPHGRYSNPRICHEENILAVSAHLKNTELTSVDYQTAVKNAKRGDFVYFDPPYFPLNETSSFTSYHANQFDAQDQRDLCQLATKLKKRGCHVMLSNSATDFIHGIYEEAGFKVHSVLAARNINSKGDKRGKVKEVIITS